MSTITTHDQPSRCRRDGVVCLRGVFDFWNWRSMPDFEHGYYERLGWDLVPGDCLLFDFRTIHAGSGQSATSTVRRMTFRLGGDDVRFQPRGEWTREISDYLVQQGQRPGEPLDNPLTPLIFER